MKLTALSTLALGLVMIPSSECQDPRACPRSCSCRVNANAPRRHEGRPGPELTVSCNDSGGDPPTAPTPPLGSQEQKLVRLDVIGAQSTELRELLQGLPGLEDLRISNALDPNIAWHNLFGSSCCSNLSTLVIRHSRIKNLRSDAFVKLEALTHLDLSYNELVGTFPGDSDNNATTSADNWKNEDGQLSNASENQGLNPLEDKIDVEQSREDNPFLLQLSPAVQELLLAHNNITNIAMISSSSLTVLDLSYNFIARLHPAQIALAGLTKLSIGGPYLELQRGLLSPATLPKLETLELLGTAHHHLTLGRGVERDVGALVAQQLNALTLDRCRLSSIVLVTNVPNSRLQYLSVTNSALVSTRTMIRPFNMSSVTSLNFQGSPFLAKNFLDPPGRQKYRQTPLPQLTTLVVANAEVKTLPPNIFTRLPQLQELDISNNPLHCTCENFAWLVGFVALKRLTLMNADTTTCAHPQYLEGKLFLQEDLCTSTPTNAPTAHREVVQENTTSSVTRSSVNSGTDNHASSENSRINLQQPQSKKKAPASLASNHKNLYDKDTSPATSTQNIFVAALVAVAFLGLIVSSRKQWMQRNVPRPQEIQDSTLTESASM